MDEMINLDRMLLRRLDPVLEKGRDGFLDDMIAAVQAPDIKVKILVAIEQHTTTHAFYNMAVAVVSTTRPIVVDSNN
jgi:hypothetical protein